MAGFFLINSADFGVCSDDADVRACLIGDTVVTDAQTLFLVYTPLLFAPIAFVVAGVAPRWAEPLGLGSQIALVVAGLTLVASGFTVLNWGAGPAAAVAFLVGAAGAYVGVRSWRAQRAGAE